MSLVYTTLLSLVPLIAVSFSVLKGFGVHNQVEPMLANMLLPLGDKGPEITDKIISFVENMKMGVLGGVGLIMLIYTVISLISKIESAFNYTWHINSSRTAAQRFSNYLSIVMVGPVMMFAAIGITASFASNRVIDALNQYQAFGQFLQLVGYLLPFAIIIAAFTFVYMLVPNVRVNFKSALYGAFFSGVTWELLGRAFASFANGSTSYTAIYSGFAILILFMIWLYLGWLVLLTGANIAYYHQNPERLTWDKQNLHLNGRLKQQSMLQIMLLIGQSHTEKTNHKITLSFLSTKLMMPEETITDLLRSLAKAQYIKSSSDADIEYFLTKSTDLISVADIFHCARSGCENTHDSFPVNSAVTKLMLDYEQVINGKFADTKLSQLIENS